MRVGHNVSERRARELAAAARSRSLAGWVITKGGIEEPQTPAGVLARGSTLAARCGKRPDCGRRVTFDAGMWCARGLGDTPLAEVLATYRCGLLPCRLGWAAESYPDGPPLGARLHDQAAHVVVGCPCGQLSPKTYPVREFAAEVLRAAGPSALALPIAPVRPPEPVPLPSALIRGACPWCAQRRWRILLHPTPPRVP